MAYTCPKTTRQSEYENDKKRRAEGVEAEIGKERTGTRQVNSKEEFALGERETGEDQYAQAIVVVETT